MAALAGDGKPHGMLVVSVAMACALLFMLVLQPDCCRLVGYEFRQPSFETSEVRITLEASGAGQMRFVRKGLSEPVSVRIAVSSKGYSELQARLVRTRYLSSITISGDDQRHTNLGITRVWLESDGHGSPVVEFYYADDRNLAAVQDWFRGLTRRELARFDIETAARYRPLDLPGLLDRLGEDLKRGLVTDADGLKPLLVSIQDDPSLPLIARNRAASIARAVAP
jgi:hypothetical protein